ncbi:hypothetical protein Hanom_Chr04g00382581 [Helianthus anomalus]
MWIIMKSARKLHNKNLKHKEKSICSLVGFIKSLTNVNGNLINLRQFKKYLINP